MRHRSTSLPLLLLLLACAVSCGDAEEEVAGPSFACLEIPHTDAADWREAFDASFHGAFLSIWGTGPCDIVTVGGQPDKGVAFSFDGVDWRKVALPPDVPMLNWVHGAEGEYFMVGEQGVAMRGTVDGGFELMETPTEAPLWGVFASAPDDVWAVGGDVFEEDSAPVLIHYDGRSWSSVALPASERPANALFKVLAFGPSNVLTVGQFGLAYHFDGSAWRELSTGTGEDLISLWGNRPTDVVVAGGRSNGVLARFDGANLDAEVLAGRPALNGVWVDGGGVAHMVGIFGTILRVDKGGAVTAEMTNTREVLHGTWGVDGGPRFAVGGSLSRNPPYVGVVLIDP